LFQQVKPSIPEKSLRSPEIPIGKGFEIALF
jgi:hypothetical protein